MRTKYLLPLLAAAILTGCMEDKGNYKYHDINDIAIKGVEVAYNCIPGEKLSIPIELIYSLGEPQKEPGFLWELNGKVISEEKDLELTIENIKYGRNSGRLIVTDNDTGMKYFATFLLNVVNGINWGYYFLTEGPDNSTILAYMPAIFEEKARRELKVSHLSYIENFHFGNKPSHIGAYFGFVSSLDSYFWTFAIATHEGEYKVVETNNGTFKVNMLFSNNNFIDAAGNYDLDPEYLGYTGRDPNYIISHGQIIIFNQGLLYRPARHDKEYYWSHPILTECYAHIFMFDKYSQKFYAVSPQKTDPEKGTVSDRYAYDLATEITFPGMEDNPPSFDGHYILGSTVSYTTEGKGRLMEYINLANVVTGDSKGIYMTTLSMHCTRYKSIETPEVRKEFPNVTGIDENSQAICQSAWYVSAGDKIYKSPSKLPKFDVFVTLPPEYGKITRMNLTAFKKLLVVTTYNEKGVAEKNGSILFIDLETGEIVNSYINVIDKCVSFLCANTNPNNGSTGDAK